MICYHCTKDLPEALFKKKIGVGLAKRCQPCRDKLGIYQKKSYGGKRPIDYHRQYNYGMDREDFDRMVLDQDGLCAICGLVQIGENRSLAVDHCHTTGKVRGLLCDPCNLGLGNFKDNPENLLKAAEYLKSLPEDS